jgi:hypothetical protein
MYQNGENIPNYHNMYQMVIKYTYQLAIKIDQKTPTYYIANSSRIYPNWDFWFENIPSGNPVR